MINLKIIKDAGFAGGATPPDAGRPVNKGKRKGGIKGGGKKGSSVGFPTTIPGIQVWVGSEDLSNELYTDLARTTKVSTPGDLVESWTDKSGNDNHMISSGTNRPKYQTGYVESVGNDNMQSTNSITCDNEFLLGLRFQRKTSSTNGGGWVSIGSTPTSNGPFFDLREDTSTAAEIFVDGGWRFTGLSCAINTTHTMIVRSYWTGTTYFVQLWWDGVYQFTYDAGAGLTFAGSNWPLWIMAGYFTQPACYIYKAVYATGENYGPPTDLISDLISYLSTD